MRHIVSFYTSVIMLFTKQNSVIMEAMVDIIRRKKNQNNCNKAARKRVPAEDETFDRLLPLDNLVTRKWQKSMPTPSFCSTVLFNKLALCGIWCFSNPNSRSQQTKRRKRSLPQPEMILSGSLKKRTVVSSEQKQEIPLHKYLEVKRNSTFFILYGLLDTTLYNQWF